jgi:hypothetical protein
MADIAAKRVSRVFMVAKVDGELRCDYSCVTMAVKLSDEIEFVYGNRFGRKYSMILKKASGARDPFPCGSKSTRSQSTFL